MTSDAEFFTLYTDLVAATTKFCTGITVIPESNDTRRQHTHEQTNKPTDSIKS